MAPERPRLVHVSSSPGRSADGPGSQLVRAIDANLQKAKVSGQVIVGDGNQQLQLNVEKGGTLNLIAPQPPPILVQPPIRLLPADPKALVGREAVLARLRRLIEERRVEITGEDGIGKTSVVAHILHQVVQTRDRVVYVDCTGHRSSDGILAALFFAFYDCDYAVAPAPEATRKYLQPVAGLVALDHVNLERSELERILNCTPGCETLVVSTQRRLAGLASSQFVGGLAPAAGAALLAQALGGVVMPDQDADLQALALAWDGHPLRLHRCADLVRDGAVPIAELINAGVRIRDVGTLDGWTAATLDGESQRVLLLLAAVAPHPLDEDQLAGVTGTTQGADLFRELTRRGLIESHSPRYSIRPALDQVITGEYQEQQEHAVAAARSYVEWMPSADLVQLHASAGALMRLQHAAFMAEDYPTTTALARGLETVLAITGRWRDWERTLSLAQLAARQAADAAGEAWASHQQGVHAYCAGDAKKGERLFQAAAQQRRSLGDDAGADISEHNLRMAHQAASLEVELAEPAELTETLAVEAAAEPEQSGTVIGAYHPDENEQSEGEDEAGGQLTMGST
jgi:hypothetical protein